MNPRGFNRTNRMNPKNGIYLLLGIIVLGVGWYFENSRGRMELIGQSRSTSPVVSEPARHELFSSSREAERYPVWTQGETSYADPIHRFSFSAPTMLGYERLATRTFSIEFRAAGTKEVVGRLRYDPATIQPLAKTSSSYKVWAEMHHPFSGGGKSYENRLESIFESGPVMVVHLSSLAPDGTMRDQFYFHRAAQTNEVYELTLFSKCAGTDESPCAAVDMDQDSWRTRFVKSFVFEP